MIQTRVKVLRHVRDEIRAHAQASVPAESVGIVMLVGDVAADYWPLRNIAAHAIVRFEVDPVELADVFAGLAGTRLTPCLCHSHVHGGEEPSANDLDNLGWPFDRVPYFIHSVARDRLAAWQLREGRVWTRAG